MRPWLLASLAVTLAASAVLALWPAEPATDLLPPGRSSTGARAVIAPASTAAQMPPPMASAVASSPSPGLPTRPADWPPPSAAALAAWQGAPEPPPKPSAKVAATVAPRAQAPAFPYRWIGQLDDGGAPQVLLAGAQRTVAVRLGAALDNRWRLQHGTGGVLQAQPLPDGEPLPVPGAPLAASSSTQP